MDTHIVIMAGGVGSRLYPLSTPEHPKQFIDLLSVGKTMIQLTYERFLRVNPDAKFWVVTSSRYYSFVKEQLPDVPQERILLEPEARNTAPCIAYACRKIRIRYPDASVVVTPADAYVPDYDLFAAVIREALDFSVSKRSIVCVGIEPTRPETGYGYIKATEKGNGVLKVDSIKEKPNLETAELFIKDPSYSWNAGIFVWTVRTVEEELGLYAPGIEAVMDKLEPYLYTEKENDSLAELFPECEKISIDYAVMEKSSDVYVINYGGEWSDLGSFESIEKITGKKFTKDLDN